MTVDRGKKHTFTKKRIKKPELLVRGRLFLVRRLCLLLLLLVVRSQGLLGQPGEELAVLDVFWRR